jgi:hypothetical protein
MHSGGEGLSDDAHASVRTNTHTQRATIPKGSTKQRAVTRTEGYHRSTPACTLSKVLTSPHAAYAPAEKARPIFRNELNPHSFQQADSLFQHI